MSALRSGAIGTPEYTDKKLAALRDEVKQLHADLARLTHDAAAECGRLRAELAEAQRHVEGFVRAGAQLCRERDALRAAAQATIDTFEPDDPHTEPTYDTPRGNARAALRAAVAACMLEEKQP